MKNFFEKKQLKALEPFVPKHKDKLETLKGARRGLDNLRNAKFPKPKPNSPPKKTPKATEKIATTPTLAKATKP
jgi:hypothetical protein